MGYGRVISDCPLGRSLTKLKDMIDDYPNCTYEGCDIVNVIDVNVMPKQFTFTIANVLEGLPYPDNSFDFVHMRLFIYALKKEEWPIAVKELLRVTKPGGFVQLMETDNPVSCE